MTITFAGDCPKMESEEWLGNVIVHYNPDTMGWDNCDWSAKKGHLHLKQLMFYVIEKCKDVWLD